MNDSLTQSGLIDDLAAGYQLQDQPLIGRIVRLGPAIDEVLTRHDYPEAVAGLLGEICVLASLVGSSLKFQGRLIVQAQGQGGPVRFVTADYDASGDLRGYAGFDQEAVQALEAETPRPNADQLLGGGVLILTLDQGADFERQQGVVSLEGESLSDAAERYFAQSEQIPTRVRLGVGRVFDGQGERWRAGGLSLQTLAGDAARGETAHAFEHGEALFNTLGVDELVDPTVPADRLLYRLFHEDGVRMNTPTVIRARCRCSHERVMGMLKSFPQDEVEAMRRDDGMVEVRCEYCSRDYRIAPDAVQSSRSSE
ncbi:Hsp33 family molecular chaperone [Brevundimonas sp. 2R-24]|uniref:Hsp33 family molecular chaperone n=1 Tax=Peiella sedimenti TaxID=3061083 RepID=A0ABT8SK71_9CAUL|nr:Hsp33 family molecular chaperone [Caulobacteraceae bacterium XZ-24]